MSKRDFVRSGLHYGEHGFAPEEIVAQFKKYGKGHHLAMIRPKDGVPVTPEQYYEIAKYFKDNKIYFCFLYAVIEKNKEVYSLVPKEVVDKIYEIAGEYFIGDALGEMGNKALTHLYRKYGKENVQFKNLTEAKNHFVSEIKEYVDASRAAGMKYIGIVESHAVMKYALEAGVDECYPEVLMVNPEQMMAFSRGAAKGIGNGVFSCYVAPEWYAGADHNDPLKMKRFGLMYRTAYMAGADKIFLESGFESISAYGVKGDENHPYCKSVRADLEKVHEFFENDKRPSGGPKVKVAFISGYLDGYSGDGLSSGGVRASMWGQHCREEWSKNAPEHSFEVLNEVYRSCDWHNVVNYGDYDYSSAPAYGLYDVLPIEAPVETMKKYDWLIFAGWNTMTEENYNKLKEYVKAGGNLLISAAHLKVGDVRGEDSPYICDGKFEDFFGCNITGERFRSNKSYKFAREGLVKGVYFHGPSDHTQNPIDPIGANGHATYTCIEEKGCRKTIYLAESFAGTVKDYETEAPVVVENSYGDGKVMLMCTDEYPGAKGVYTLYTILVKAIMSATHRNADVKVIANDKVRFAVYENDEIYKVYLLNTDMNFEQKARVIYGGKNVDITVGSTEIESVVLEKQ